MQEEVKSLAEALAVQAEVWFRNLLKSHNIAPRTFTGISRSGQQFISIIENIQWTRPQHIQCRVFLNWICRKEDVVAYAYGGLWGIDDGSRAIQIVADDGDNIVDLVIPLLDRDDGTCVYDESKIYRTQAADNEWRPYTNLMRPDIIETDSIDPTDEANFEKWWATLRSKSNWRQVSL